MRQAFVTPGGDINRVTICPKHFFEGGSGAPIILNQQYVDRKLEQVDGIKIDLGDEWVLILPDPDGPFFHIIAEGSSEEQARVAAVIEECTSTISREVAGLKAMVDEFSRFARLPHPRLEPGDLNEVIRQSASLYEDRTDGAQLQLNLAAELPATVLDAEQMRRVFVNLIDNSLAALAEGSNRRQVTITTSHDIARETIVTEVCDTGEGIRTADLKRLFQPYFSTRERGTGLGLAIVHRIITEHGGRIRAEANQPQGAKFVIELPAAVGPEVGGQKSEVNSYQG